MGMHDGFLSCKYCKKCKHMLYQRVDEQECENCGEWNSDSDLKEEVKSKTAEDKAK